MPRSFPLCLLLLSSACTTIADADAEVTITQGVYGLTISGCDTSGCEDSAYEHAPITITPDDGRPAIRMTSDGGGFFEAALDPGGYNLCVYSCTKITIAPGERVRRDFESGPGGGLWCADGVCRPE